MRSTRPQDAAHLRQCLYRLGEVFERGSAGDEIHAGIIDGQGGGIPS
jgi:hypothetical protein